MLFGVFALWELGTYLVLGTKLAPTNLSRV